MTGSRAGRSLPVHRRIGLLGGTFDPPHLAHLAMAEWARDRLELDRVIFIPAARPPHKQRRSISDAAARLAMTRLAVRDNAAFTVSTLELERHGPSFTVDTVRAMRLAHPRARLYLLIGEDSLRDFPAWREPGAILKLASLAVAGRPGAGGGSSKRRVVWLKNPELDVSSSGIRRRVRAGRSIRYLVPDRVAAYVARHRLYRSTR